MTTLELTLNLPDDLAQRAKDAGCSPMKRSRKAAAPAVAPPGRRGTAHDARSSPEHRHTDDRRRSASRDRRLPSREARQARHALVRVVLNTNTVVSGFLWGNEPRALIDAAAEGRIELFTSERLIAEIEDVLPRARFAARLAEKQLSVSALIERYRVLADIVEPAMLSGPVSKDPDDDLVLATALAASADLIVSRATSTCETSSTFTASPSCTPPRRCGVLRRNHRHRDDHCCRLRRRYARRDRLHRRHARDVPQRRCRVARADLPRCHGASLAARLGEDAGREHVGIGERAATKGHRTDRCRPVAASFFYSAKGRTPAHAGRGESFAFFHTPVTLHSVIPERPEPLRT